jgi:hypothetical protein
VVSKDSAFVQLIVAAEIRLLETSYLSGDLRIEVSSSGQVPPQVIRVPVRRTSLKPRISPACVSFEVIPQTFNPVQHLSTSEIPRSKTAHLTGTIDH